jgi:hypothetical protein
MTHVTEAIVYFETLVETFPHVLHSSTALKMGPLSSEQGGGGTWIPNTGWEGGGSGQRAKNK